MILNPIPKSNLWATPADFDHLVTILNSCGSEEEVRMAWYGAMLALNLSNKLFDEYKETV